MMTRLAALAVAGVLAAGPAFADAIEANRAEVTLDGFDNIVTVEQAALAAPTNVARILLQGDRNGGPSGAGFAAALAGVGLTPGTVRQSGAGNRLSLDVFGSDNLFALSQAGAGNTITGVITGQANQAVIAQAGTGNTASFSQSGAGNMLSIVQNSQ